MIKKIVLSILCTYFMLNCSSAFAQKSDSTSTGPIWSHNLEASFYIFSDDFIFMPVYTADRDWLHLEARYNYEDRNTFSVWAGYNFTGGEKLEYTITPMLGGLIGNTNGFAPGLEISLGFHGIELFFESEYVFDINDGGNDFYYNWTDLTYSPRDWIWFGLSFQHTRLIKTDLKIQRGLLLGGSYKWIGLSTYLYNLGFDEPYLILSLLFAIPQ